MHKVTRDDLTEACEAAIDCALAAHWHPLQIITHWRRIVGTGTPTEAKLIKFHDATRELIDDAGRAYRLLNESLTPEVLEAIETANAPDNLPGAFIGKARCSTEHEAAGEHVLRIHLAAVCAAEGPDQARRFVEELRTFPETFPNRGPDTIVAEIRRESARALKAAIEDAPTPTSTPQRPRSARLSQAEMARRILHDEKARPRDLGGAFFERHGYEPATTKTGTILLDGFGEDIRKALSQKLWAVTKK